MYTTKQIAADYVKQYLERRRKGIVRVKRSERNPNTLAKGMLSLFQPAEPPPLPSYEEMQCMVWQSVGDALRSAMKRYEQTDEYKQALGAQSKGERRQAINR